MDIKGTSGRHLATAVREQIITAASAEFAANGLRGASVRKVAARAGVTAAMINYYYGSKQALYDIVVERAQAKLFASISDALHTPSAPDLSSRLAVAYFDFLCEEQDLPRLLLREVLDDGENLQVVLRKYIQPLRVMFEDRFGNGDEAFQALISVFGAVAGYFMYAPVLASILGSDPLSQEALSRRRAHVTALAEAMAPTRQ